MSGRRPQHRPPRETEARTAAELRAECRSLRRQLSKLRRENERLQGIVEEVSPEHDETTGSVVEVCPKCGSPDLGKIKTPNGKVVTSCRSCKKWRSKASDSE